MTRTAANIEILVLRLSKPRGLCERCERAPKRNAVRVVLWTYLCDRCTVQAGGRLPS